MCLGKSLWAPCYLSTFHGIHYGIARTAKSNTAMPTDITEIKTLQAKLHLCVELDLFDQRIVGWSMHHRQRRQMMIRAVQMAL